MGRLALEDMLEQASFEQALAWHLTGNHFPPLPLSLLPVCKQAIALAAKGEWETTVSLAGTGVYHRVYGEDVPVQVCMDAWHLHEFLPDEGDSHE